MSDRRCRTGADGLSLFRPWFRARRHIPIRPEQSRRPFIVIVHKGIDLLLGSRHIASMPTPRPADGSLAATLRSARSERRLSIAQLALLANVSPRLISELERGMRAHVSFETATRLLQLVDVSVAFDRQPHPSSDAAARAARRARSWSGVKTTLATETPPQSSSSAAERLDAVARASRLTAGLQNAYGNATARRASKIGK